MVCEYRPKSDSLQIPVLGQAELIDMTHVVEKGALILCLNPFPNDKF